MLLKQLLVLLSTGTVTAGTWVEQINDIAEGSKEKALFLKKVLYC